MVVCFLSIIWFLPQLHLLMKLFTVIVTITHCQQLPYFSADLSLGNWKLTHPALIDPEIDLIFPQIFFWNFGVLTLQPCNFHLLELMKSSEKNTLLVAKNKSKKFWGNPETLGYYMSGGCDWQGGRFDALMLPLSHTHPHQLWYKRRQLGSDQTPHWLWPSQHLLLHHYLVRSYAMVSSYDLISKLKC